MRIFAFLLVSFLMVFPALSSEKTELSFLDAANRPVSLQNFSGKIVILNIWASWCPPCVQEMPDLIALQKTYAAQGLQLIALSEDIAGFPTITPFLEKNNWQDLPVYWDKGGINMRHLGASGLPTSYIFNRAGKLLEKIEGNPQWTSTKMVAKIEKYLEQK